MVFLQESEITKAAKRLSKYFDKSFQELVSAPSRWFVCSLCKVTPAILHGVASPEYNPVQGDPRVKSPQSSYTDGTSSFCCPPPSPPHLSTPRRVVDKALSKFFDKSSQELVSPISFCPLPPPHLKMISLRTSLGCQQCSAVLPLLLSKYFDKSFQELV